MALLGYTFTPGLARNTVKALDELPVLLNGLSSGDIATELSGKYGWSEEQEMRFKALLTRHKGEIERLVPTMDRYLSNTAEIFGCLLLIPILAIFFLRDGERIVNVLIGLFFRPDRRPKIHAFAKELHVVLTQYIRAQVLLCVLSFVFYSATMHVLRFPHAIVLGTVRQFAGIYSSCRLDEHLRYRCRRRYLESLPLGVSGGTDGHLESDSELFCHGEGYR